MSTNKNIAFVLRHSFVIRHSCFVIRLSSIVVSELPKTATGKVQKYVLRGKLAISTGPGFRRNCASLRTEITLAPCRTLQEPGNAICDPAFPGSATSSITSSTLKKIFVCVFPCVRV